MQDISLTFSKFISVLEGLDKAQRLIHRATHRQVIDGDLPQDALAVDDKQAPERHKQKGYSDFSASFHLVVVGHIIG